MSQRVQTGSPDRRGATWDGRGVNFAIFSAHAEKIELCLFDERTHRELDRIALPERTDDVFHGYFPDISPGQVYGYRVHGPYQPTQGHRFNHHKLMLDPYAKATTGPLIWTDAHFGYRVGSARADLSFDRRDNARAALKAIVVDDAFTWGDDRPPRISWADTFFYEAHVKGLTTAAGLWMTAAIGVAAGLGKEATALLSTILALAIFSVMPYVVRVFEKDVDKNDHL